jgi:hypothetical protein
VELLLMGCCFVECVLIGVLRDEYYVGPKKVRIARELGVAAKQAQNFAIPLLPQYT